MTDREKVLRAYTVCIDADGDCYHCPYYEEDHIDPEQCDRKALRDVLELLKAQEPRVLALEEAKKAEVCWLEQRGYEPYVTDDAYTWNPEIYGKAYRCWSANPTDEQRKAVKWDA